MRPVRHAYEELGPAGFYELHGATYRNPHEAAIRGILRELVAESKICLASVYDLACGSGEVTLALREFGCTTVAGCDPYTAVAYQERTGLVAEPHSFEDVAAGALAGRNFTLVVCSFALHLLDESWLPALATQLALVSDALLILTPHKRPHIRPEWGWQLVEERTGNDGRERVRARLYRSEMRG